MPPALEPPWLATTRRSERDASSSSTVVGLAAGEDLRGRVDPGLGGLLHGALDHLVRALHADRGLARGALAGAGPDADERQRGAWAGERDRLLDGVDAAAAAVEPADDAAERRRHVRARPAGGRRASHGPRR